MKLIGLILLTCLNSWFMGCGPVMTSGSPAIKNENVMNQIKSGITDKNTVYQLLGTPMAAHNLPSGEIWMYHYGEVNRKFKLIGWGGLFDSTIDSQSAAIQITFDDRGIVKAISGRPTGLQQSLKPQTQDLSSPPGNLPEKSTVAARQSSPSQELSLIDIKEKAEQGNPKEQNNLGLMYANGKGIKQDWALAKLWWEKAAAQGFAEAQFNLGVMYANGEGVKQDWPQAKLWYGKAGARGFAKAQFNLGNMYYKGEGVKQDLSQAKLWFEKAAAQGIAEANEMIDKLKSN